MVARALRNRGARWRLGLFAGVAALLLAWAAWRLLATPQPAVREPQASVPEHQRSGPLANPWGTGPAVVGGERAVEPGASSTLASASAAASAARPRDPTAWLAAPAALDAVRAALAQLRASPGAAEFVQRALQGLEPAALVAAWMIERQCRQAVQWRQIVQWRERIAPGRPAARSADSGSGSGSTVSETRCREMPEASAIDSALSTAGFVPAADQAPELTRRPIALAMAMQIGDPVLTAEVLQATDSSGLPPQLQAMPGIDPRDLTDPQVARAAVWLASCAPRDAAGRAIANSTGLHEACRDHPALRDACLQQGLCDLRDLRDLLLRTLTAQELGACERVARALVAATGAPAAAGPAAPAARSPGR